MTYAMLDGSFILLLGTESSPALPSAKCGQARQYRQAASDGRVLLLLRGT